MTHIYHFKRADEIGIDSKTHQHTIAYGNRDYPNKYGIFPHVLNDLYICPSLTFPTGYKTLENLVKQANKFRYWNDCNLSRINMKFKGFKYEIREMLHRCGIFREGCDIILEYAAPVNLTDFTNAIKKYDDCYSYAVHIRFVAYLPHIWLKDGCDSDNCFPFMIAIDQHEILTCRHYLSRGESTYGSSDPQGFIDSNKTIFIQNDDITMKIIWYNTHLTNERKLKCKLNINTNKIYSYIMLDHPSKHEEIINLANTTFYMYVKHPEIYIL